MRYAREKARLGQQKIADSIGVSKRTYIKYEQNESKIKKPMVKEIAEICNIAPDWLLTGSGSPESRKAPFPKPTDGENKTVPNSLSDRYVYLPLYDVEASAGHGSMIHSEQIIDHLAFLREWVQKELGLNPERVLLIKAIGDSMTPTIKAGALLLVNMEVTKVRNDSIYIIRQDGDLLVKRVQNLMDGRVEIKSDNADYKPIIVQSKTLDVIGEVVWGGQRF